MADQRELLELAALACGLSVQGETTHLGVFTGLSIREDDYPGGYRWNPLTDDGDCARMEAQLLIDLDWYEFDVRAKAAYQHGIDASEDFDGHNNDRNAARRLASLRVAAEIGKRIQQETQR